MSKALDIFIRKNKWERKKKEREREHETDSSFSIFLMVLLEPFLLLYILVFQVLQSDS